MAFNEITQRAVTAAFDNPRSIDMALVDAQQARRAVDRIVGYKLSPLLWKKVQTGLSAGRVQSVAVRLIVEREEERRAFNAAVYWDLEARLKGDGREFLATLVRVDDDRVATGKDFDPQTGALKNQKVRLLGEADAGVTGGDAGELAAHLGGRIGDGVIAGTGLLLPDLGYLERRWLLPVVCAAPVAVVVALAVTREGLREHERPRSWIGWPPSSAEVTVPLTRPGTSWAIAVPVIIATNATARDVARANEMRTTRGIMSEPPLRDERTLRSG